MELKSGFKTFYPKTRKAWRNWLEKHHDKEQAVWLIIYHKASKKPTVYYADAVEEALCFGWIDSRPNKRDEESYFLFFSRRSPKSHWSKINKERVQRLEEQGLITAAGQRMIDLAKQNGNWTALETIDEMIIPADLKALLRKNAVASKHFKAFPPSIKKGILFWITSAKQPATREKRIKETIELAAQNIRANQYVPPGDPK